MTVENEIDVLVCEARIVRRRALLTMLQTEMCLRLWRRSVEESKMTRETAAELRRALAASNQGK